MQQHGEVPVTSKTYRWREENTTATAGAASQQGLWQWSRPTAHDIQYGTSAWSVLGTRSAHAMPEPAAGQSLSQGRV